MSQRKTRRPTTRGVPRGATRAAASRVGLVPMALFAITVTAPVAAGLFRVWVNQDAVQIGYALSEEASRQRRVADMTQKLELELAAARSPERLASLARKLGLSAPPAERMFGPPRDNPGGARGP